MTLELELANAKTSSEALRVLYDRRKVEYPKMSYASLCNAIGMTSTGYWSDILSHKRAVHPKYKQAVSKFFGLQRESARCLKLLIEIDNESNADRKNHLLRQLALTHKVLKAARRKSGVNLEEFVLSLEVFCAFGLFKNEPTTDQLIAYFGEEKRNQVLASIESLKHQKLITDNGPRLRLLIDQISFDEAQSGVTHLDFLRIAFSHAAANVAQWFPRKEESFFASSIISVKKAEYVDLLPSLKSRFFLAESELESGNADTLVRFNVQIYPVT